MAFTTDRIPIATDGTHLADGSLTDNGSGAVGSAQGIDLTLTGFTGPAGTSTYGGRVSIQGGPSAAGANYGGRADVTGGLSADYYGGPLYLRGGAGNVRGGTAKLEGGAASGGSAGTVEISGGLGGGTVGSGGAVFITGGGSNGVDTNGASVVIRGGNANDGEIGDVQIQAQALTPASAAAPGQPGALRWDADFIYICVATNAWKRVAIATWP